MNDINFTIKSKEYYVAKANENTPEILSEIVMPTGFASVIEDKNALFGIGVKSAEPKKCFGGGDSIVVDFGNHYVGNFSFKISRVDRYLDAPVKLRFQFAEVPAELTDIAATYKGTLCSSWIQDEVMIFDDEGLYTLPRRYSFRYVKITVIASSKVIRLTDFSIKTQSSADFSKVKPLDNITDEELIKIDAVAQKTLADCMQLVYEDGPKRDRRLWSGDLYLQLLTDLYVFKNYTLMRRCLYLFASCFKDGEYLPACLYYRPNVYADPGHGIADYAHLYTASLCEYFFHTGDKQTAIDLFPIAKNQIDLTIKNLDNNGIITLLSGWNSFIDWAPKKIMTAEQGVFLYVLEKNIKLAKALGYDDVASEWTTALNKGRKDAYKQLFNAQKCSFINEYDDNFYSVYSQVWMVLGGVGTTDEGKKALLDALNSPDSLKPVTPYMHHYVVEALFKLGLNDEGIKYIKNYWGGMVNLGADTFFEVYVPDNLEKSPYCDKFINSFCHAWSCSPSYFIRKYL